MAEPDPTEPDPTEPDPTEPEAAQPARPGRTVVVPPAVVAALRGVSGPICAYVYDRSVLRDRAAALRAALPPGVEVLYAVKANSHPEVVATLAGAVHGLEVASGGELDLVRGLGPVPGTVAFSGPAKTDAELRAAVAAGAVVHVESRHELSRLALAAERLSATGTAAAGTTGTATGTAAAGTTGTATGSGAAGTTGTATGGGAVAAIRVNRAGSQLPGTHRMTGGPSQFGVDEAELPRLLADLPPRVRIIGFHLHAVSNNLDSAAHAAFIGEAVAWSVRTAAAYRMPLRYVNVGGGLGVDYVGEREFDLAVLAAGLRAAAAALPPGARLVLEPGRWLVADAGWYASEVLDVKRSHGRWYAVVRGGTHHFRLPAAWGYSHPCAVLPVDEWRYPLPRPQLRDTAVDIAGELCTPRDVLARDRWMARLRVGDVLVFDRAGGYGWDISHHDFLRHRYPEMVVI